MEALWECYRAGISIGVLSRWDLYRSAIALTIRSLDRSLDFA